MRSYYQLRRLYIVRNKSTISSNWVLPSPKGFKVVAQSSGVRKEYWDVTWGLKKAWFDDLVTALLAAELDSLNILFRDTYRDTNFHLVRLQDGQLRVNQHYQDYLRLNGMS